MKAANEVLYTGVPKPQSSSRSETSDKGARESSSNGRESCMEQRVDHTRNLAYMIKTVVIASGLTGSQVPESTLLGERGDGPPCRRFSDDEILQS